MMFTIIIPAIRPDTLETVINSIRRQSLTDWQLIVVGQGSSRELHKVTKTLANGDERIQYHHIEINGTTRARNAGFSIAKGEIISFIDDDCEAKDNWLEIIAGYFERHRDIGVVGGSVLQPPQKPKFMAVCPSVIPAETIYDPIESQCKPPDGFGWIGCNVSCRREVIDAVGPFDSFLGPGTHFPAGEDMDYLLRLEQMGIKMLSTPRAVVVHRFGIRIGFRAMLNHSRNYVCGNAGVAGKLTLSGDNRGVEWLNYVKAEVKNNLLRKPFRSPVDLRKLNNFVESYNFCLDNYTVRDGLLNYTPRS